MYYLITVKWMGGFTHKVPARHYNLKSQINFTKSLQYVDEYSYEKVSEEEYNKYFYGEQEKEQSDGSGKQRKAQQTSPAKRKPRKEASKDSKAAGDRRKGTPSIRKAQPSKLREPKVSDVRKPKKDTKGTNSAGKKTTTRSRSTTRQTKQRASSR